MMYFGHERALPEYNTWVIRLLINIVLSELKKTLTLQVHAYQ